MTDKFESADDKGRTYAKRDIYWLPNVGIIIDGGPKAVIDLKVESGETFVPTEVKYRPNSASTDYANARIQCDTKYKAVKEANGFLYMRFKDGIWYLWDLGKVKPCETGWWTHSKHTVLKDGDITDRYAAFAYKDALYTNANDRPK